MILTTREIERRIARALVTDAIAAGYGIRVPDTNENTPDGAVTLTDVDAVLGEMFHADDDRVYMIKDGNTVGWVLFVYGNDGWDVICDYTTNLEPIMGTAKAMSDNLGDNLGDKKGDNLTAEEFSLLLKSDRQQALEWFFSRKVDEWMQDGEEEIVRVLTLYAIDGHNLADDNTIIGLAESLFD
jgi:hypothetical protein